MNTLTTLSSAALTSRIHQLIGDERRTLVDFLKHLAEVERRKLHLDLGYSSLFAYCTEGLKLSKACAHRRTTCAQLLVRFPLAADYLADGRLGLTTLSALAKVLTNENHDDLLERAANCTEEEVELLVVTLAPKPERSESLRAAPVRIGERRIESQTLEVGSGPELPSNDSQQDRPSSGAEPVATFIPVARPAKLQPATAERFNLSMSVSREFADELKQVTAALSHIVPSGRMEDVLHECIRIALAACERRRGGLPQPKLSTGSGAEPAETLAATADDRHSGSGPELDRTESHAMLGEDAEASSGAEPDTRYIPADVRRAVWKRDGGRCVFVGTSGHRCSSAYQLQLNHRVPFARGGTATIENLELVCAAHNRRLAEFDFGEAFMAQFNATG